MAKLSEKGKHDEYRLDRDYSRDRGNWPGSSGEIGAIFHGDCFGSHIYGRGACCERAVVEIFGGCRCLIDSARVGNVCRRGDTPMAKEIKEVCKVGDKALPLMMRAEREPVHA